MSSGKLIQGYHDAGLRHLDCMSATWEITVEYNTPLKSLIIQAVSITMCETCLQEVEGDK